MRKFILAAAACAAFVAPAQARDFTAAEMKEIAEQVQQKLARSVPQQLDRNSLMTSVMLQDKDLILYVDIVNAEASYEEMLQRAKDATVRNEIRTRMVNQACSNYAIKAMMGYGYNMVFRYADGSTGKFVMKETITGRDCK